MTWNWQHNHWPNFNYDSDQLAAYERKFLLKAGMMQGSACRLGIPKSMANDLVSVKARNF